MKQEIILICQAQDKTAAELGISSVMGGPYVFLVGLGDTKDGEVTHYGMAMFATQTKREELDFIAEVYVFDPPFSAVMAQLNLVRHKGLFDNLLPSG